MIIHYKANPINKQEDRALSQNCWHLVFFYENLFIEIWPLSKRGHSGRRCQKQTPPCLGLGQLPGITCLYFESDIRAN